MNQVDDRAARLVAFWRAVEMFSPRAVPKPEPLTNDAKLVVLDLSADHLAPWQPGHQIAQRRQGRGWTWRFTVYGGLYQLDAVRDTLTRICGGDRQEPDGRKGGTTALFTFMLDGNGRLVEDSASLASCAWAVGRAVSPGPDDPRWLDGFEDAERGFGLGLNQLAPPKPPGAGTPGPVSTVLDGIGRQVKGAARDAVKEGAKATGHTVTAVAAVAVGSVAGPVVGGIAGSVAGKFAEKLLTPPEEPKHGPADQDAAAAAARPRRTPRTMTTRDLHEFVAELAEHLGVAETLRPSGVRVRCQLVRDADDPPEQDFLNSYIAGDLAQVQRAVGNGDIGTGLWRYLADTPDDPDEQRIDVRRNTGHVIAGVAPKMTPGGRWPTELDTALVLSQQFAVNRIMADLSDDAGIFAVNGPPGTGKTTMLRDVVAAVLVHRADELAKLHHPEDAFSTELYFDVLAATLDRA